MSYETLERNIAALLRKSYAPALPTPLFRDRLAARFHAALAERRRPPRALPRLALALAAAAVLLVLALRFLVPAPSATRATLLAAGEVALELADGSWRAADADEHARGLAFVPPRVVVVTPPERGLAVHTAAGRIELAAASELHLFAAPELCALLLAGKATFHGPDGARALPGGTRFTLAPTSAVDTASVAGQRESQPTIAAPPPAAGSGRALRGRVRSAEDDVPVARFTVGLLRERQSNATYPPVTRAFESADGTFAWPEPPRGKQRVFVHAPGFALAALGEFALDGELPELDVRLERGLELAGTVRDVDGHPLAGVLVIAEDEVPTDGLFFGRAEDAFWLPVQTRSGADGRFTLSHVSGGPQGNVLRASADGYAPTWRVGVQPGAECALVLRRGGTLEGLVTGADGSPTAGAQLVVVAMEQPTLPRTNFALATSDHEGRYRVEHLPPLTMIAVLIGEDDRPDVRPLQMVDGTTVRADFGTPLVSLTLRGTLRRPEGTPIALQNIALFDRSSAKWNSDWVASTTDRRGRFEFPAVEPGRYLVFLIDEQGNQLRCVDELELGRELLLVERDVRVPAGELAVTVRTAEDGAALARVVVVLEFLEEGGDELFAALGLTGADGVAHFHEQRPGRYRVTAYPSDGQHGYATLEEVVIGAAPAEAALAVGPGGSALVSVRTVDGRPLPRAAVLFAASDGREHNFSQVPETDSDGHFRAVGLAPGIYTVRVRLDGFAPVDVELDFRPDEEALVPIVLHPTTPQ